MVVLTLCSLHDHLIQLSLQLLIHLQLLPLVRETGLQPLDTKITLTLHRPQLLGQDLNLSAGKRQNWERERGGGDSGKREPE